MGQFIDITNKKYGRLTVIKRVENNSHGDAMWFCQCDCGNTTIVRGYHLRNGKTKSCGCISIENLVNNAKKHGYYQSRIYSIWANMKARCYNPKSPHYQYYGGRGIQICDEWKNNPVAFISWALNNGYAENLTIDRKDVNGDYSPSNCQWVTMKQQNENKRSNIIITMDQETHTLKEWCSIYGVTYRTVSDRMSKGWDFMTAMTVPRLNSRGLPIMDFIEEP